MGEVTREYVESLELQNSSTMQSALIYELRPGVRIVFKACVGGWDAPEIWTGAGAIVPIPLETKEQLICLMKGLKLDGSVPKA